VKQNASRLDAIRPIVSDRQIANAKRALAALAETKAGVDELVAAGGLMTAVWVRDLELAKKLVDAGAAPGQRSPGDPSTPLEWAVSESEEAWLALLLPHADEQACLDALVEAIENVPAYAEPRYGLPWVERMLDAVSDPSRPGRRGLPPLHAAALAGVIETVELLRTKLADADAPLPADAELRWPFDGVRAPAGSRPADLVAHGLEVLRERQAQDTARGFEHDDRAARIALLERMAQHLAEAPGPDLRSDQKDFRSVRMRLEMTTRWMFPVPSKMS
jgi:hypothetical protein